MSKENDQYMDMIENGTPLNQFNKKAQDLNTDVSLPAYINQLQKYEFIPDCEPVGFTKPGDLSLSELQKLTAGYNPDGIDALRKEMFPVVTRTIVAYHDGDELASWDYKQIALAYVSQKSHQAGIRKGYKKAALAIGIIGATAIYGLNKAGLISFGKQDKAQTEVTQKPDMARHIQPTGF